MPRLSPRRKPGPSSLGWIPASAGMTGRTSPLSLGGRVSLEDLEAAAAGKRAVQLDSKARQRIAASRRVVERAIKTGRPVYGINTGFGELASKRIPASAIKTLQRNLVLSHACGVGPLLSEAQARGILFLRTNELARGFSGIRPETVGLMTDVLNSGAVPQIPSQGSVGASGDLAPQAHMALFLIGEGIGFWRGGAASSREILLKSGLVPLELEAKEGLSLINGTQAMQSVGGLAVLKALRVFKAAQIAGAASLEAMTGTPVPFEAPIHELKPHPGQIEAAKTLRTLLAHSEIRRSHEKNDPRVQDPYSLRCMPQVHGAAWDLLVSARCTVETEMRSATDNPLVIDGTLVSAGNFHGQAMSFAFDMASIALTTLSGISERRLAQLISGQSPRLSPFLAKNPGLESGWMIPQVVAAALVSENKGLAHPASVDSIPTSAGKEDFVSMGMGAALKLDKIAANAARVVAIELLAASQGIKAHRPLKPGRGVRRALEILANKIPLEDGDQVLSPKIESAAGLILNDRLF